MTSPPHNIDDKLESALLNCSSLTDLIKPEKKKQMQQMQQNQYVVLLANLLNYS